MKTLPFCFKFKALHLTCHRRDIQQIVGKIPRCTCCILNPTFSCHSLLKTAKTDRFPLQMHTQWSPGGFSTCLSFVSKPFVAFGFELKLFWDFFETVGAGDDAPWLFWTTEPSLFCSRLVWRKHVKVLSDYVLLVHCFIKAFFLYFPNK